LAAVPQDIYNPGYSIYIVFVVEDVKSTGYYTIPENSDFVAVVAVVAVVVLRYEEHLVDRNQHYVHEE
jgi:hypothetical protein